MPVRYLQVAMVVALAGLASSNAFASDAIAAATTELNNKMDSGIALGKVIISIGALIAAGGAIYNFLVEKNLKALITAAIGLAVAGAGGVILGACKAIAGT